MMLKHGGGVTILTLQKQKGGARRPAAKVGTFLNVACAKQGKKDSLQERGGWGEDARGRGKFFLSIKSD